MDTRLQKAIEQAFTRTADDRAELATIRSDLRRKGGEIFAKMMVNALPPVINHHDTLSQAKSQGESLFDRHLDIIEQATAKLKVDFNNTLRGNPEVLVGSFADYVRRSPAGKHLQVLSERYAANVSRQVDALPAHERSLLADVLADQKREQAALGEAILAELDRDLAEVESKYPATKARKPK
jgi:hypothetical protein